MADVLSRLETVGLVRLDGRYMPRYQGRLGRSDRCDFLFANLPQRCDVKGSRWMEWRSEDHMTDRLELTDCDGQKQEKYLRSKERELVEGLSL